MTGRLRLALVDPRSPAAVALRAAAAPTTTSYFLSPGWVDAWLAELPDEARPKFAIVSAGGAPIAGAFLGYQRVRRHVAVRARTWFLNATGVHRFDELCIEHNGLYAVPGAPRLPIVELAALLPEPWDELELAGVPAGEAHAAAPDVTLAIDREVVAPYVDLARVRERGDYLDLLGAGVRAQLRRARRASGEIVVEHARDAARALDILDELIVHHTASWRERGEPGAFADPWIVKFHRRLVAARFAAGEIDLVRVTAGGRLLGALYNFVYRGRVTYYQSGIDRDPDPHLKAGLLCHAAAIADAARAGHDVYDFLAGDARYKRELATDATRLAWVRLQRPRARFAVEDLVVSWKRALARV